MGAACAQTVRQKDVGGYPEPPSDISESDWKPASVQTTPLEASRRSPAGRPPHQNSEIEGTRVNQQPFEDVAMPAQVSAAHPAGVVDVSEGPFHVLAASAPKPRMPRAAVTRRRLP
jgi:hypothetical protein